MLDDIKNMLIQNPQSIVNLLKMYNFAKIKLLNNEIRCAYEENTNGSSIRIKLKNNDKLFVVDFGRDITCDLFTYLIKTRNVQFVDVVKDVKQILGINNYYEFKYKRSVFGGFYDKIKTKDTQNECVVYDNSILDKYTSAYSLKFLRDNISCEAQDHYNIMFDNESQRIIIPIYNAYGEIIGIKGRANWKLQDNDSKYLYLIRCNMSSTLYGYSQNYEYLQDNTIYVFEAEKSCMQCYSFGVQNTVALGSNSLSNQQCKLLMELNPKKIVFMLDEGLDKSITFRNIEKLKTFCRMSSVKIMYWDYDLCQVPHKASPSDLGRQKFQEIVNNYIVEM